MESIDFTTARVIYHLALFHQTTRLQTRLGGIKFKLIAVLGSSMCSMFPKYGTVLVRDREDSRKFDQRNCSHFVFEIVGGGVTQASQ